MNIIGRVAIGWLIGLGITIGVIPTATADNTATAGNQQRESVTPEILWNQILPRHLTYIQEGHGGPVVYDFQDPNCPYCHTLYDNEAPFIKEGKLTVRYVPVAFLTESSLPEAAAWLQAPNPLAALRSFEGMVGEAMESGNDADLPQADATPATSKALDTNLGIMRALGIMGTPAIIYRDKDGKLGLIPGLITAKQLAELLPHLQ